MLFQGKKSAIARDGAQAKIPGKKFSWLRHCRKTNRLVMLDEGPG